MKLNDIRVLLVSRTSHLNKQEVSRSVYDRGLEALEYLQVSGQISLNIMGESDVTDEVISSNDVLIFFRHNSDSSVKLAERAVEMGRKVIYDVDDLVINYPSYSTTGFTEAKLANFRRHIEICHVVSVGTERLLQNLNKGVPGIDRKATIIPSAFWHEKYKPDRYNLKEDEFRIVFTNTDTLKVSVFKDGLFEAINRFTSRHPTAHLEIYSDTPQELEGQFPHRFMGTAPVDAHRKLLLQRGCKAAITPLGSYEEPSTLAYNSSKFPIKYLLYGGLAIPGIYSDNPLYTDLIENERTGLIVPNNADAWADAFEKLKLDTSLRDRIARESFAEVNEKFHPRVVSQHWLKLFQEIG